MHQLQFIFYFFAEISPPTTPPCRSWGKNLSILSQFHANRGKGVSTCMTCIPAAQEKGPGLSSEYRPVGHFCTLHLFRFPRPHPSWAACSASNLSTKLKQRHQLLTAPQSKPMLHPQQCQISSLFAGNIRALHPLLAYSAKKIRLAQSHRRTATQPPLWTPAPTTSCETNLLDHF